MFAIYVKVCSRHQAKLLSSAAAFAASAAGWALGWEIPQNRGKLDEEMAMAQWLVISVKLQGTKMWVIRESFQWNFMEILSEIIKMWLAGKSPENPNAGF